MCPHLHWRHDRSLICESPRGSSPLLLRYRSLVPPSFRLALKVWKPYSCTFDGGSQPSAIPKLRDCLSRKACAASYCWREDETGNKKLFTCPRTNKPRGRASARSAVEWTHAWKASMALSFRSCDVKAYRLQRNHNPRSKREPPGILPILRNKFELSTQPTLSLRSLWSECCELPRRRKHLSAQPSHADHWTSLDHRRLLARGKELLLHYKLLGDLVPLLKRLVTRRFGIIGLMEPIPLDLNLTTEPGTQAHYSDLSPTHYGIKAACNPFLSKENPSSPGRGSTGTSQL